MEDPIKIINNLNVCIRCSLRFLQCQNFALYKAYNTIKQKQPICSICQNILPMLDQDIFINHLQQQINSQNYQFSTFKLNIKLPNSIVIRQRQLLLFLKKEYPGLQIQSHPLQLKIVLKSILASRLAQKINKSSTIENQDFIVTITFENKIADQLAFHPFKQYIRISQIESAKKKGKLPPFSLKKNKMQLDKPIQSKFINSYYTKKIIELQRQIFMKALQSQIPPIGSTASYSLQLNSKSQYIFGKYIKYSRFLPQTPWILQGHAPFETSIQEQIDKNVLKYFYNDVQRQKGYSKFHSGGRQDIDVRMLGMGRPFMLQIMNPRKVMDQKKIKELQKEINQKCNLIQVNELVKTDVKGFQILKKYQDQKVKAYSCVILFQSQPSCLSSINQINNLIIQQITPLRVLHRRTLIPRNKIIHRAKIKMISQRLGLLLVLASAGTYIKQFVHGDLGRTLPNVGSLSKCECDILQLDVIGLYQSMDEQCIKSFQQLLF